VEDIDRSDFDFWKPNENRGDPIFDSDFDLYSEASLSHIRKACQTIYDYPCHLEGCDSYFVNIAGKATRMNKAHFRGKGFECFVDSFLESANATLPGFIDGQFTDLWERKHYFRDNSQRIREIRGRSNWYKMLGRMQTVVI